MNDNVNQKDQASTPQSGEVKVDPSATVQEPKDAPKKTKKTINFDKMFAKPTAFVDRIDAKVSQFGPMKGMPVMGRRILIIVMSAFVFFVAFVIVLGLVYRLLNPPTVIKRNPIPSPVSKVTPPPLEARNPSKYAEDESVLELEQKIRDLDKQITDTNVRESTLNPPSLNFEVGFE